MMKLSYVLLGTLLLFLAGCSDDDDHQKEYYYDWRQGPDKYYLIRCFGKDTTGPKEETLAYIQQQPYLAPELYRQYDYPRDGGTTISFNTSDLPEDYLQSKVCPVLITKYRRVKPRGPLVPEFRHYDCEVRPYMEAPETVEGVQGVMHDADSWLWSIIWERDGQKCIAYTMNLGDSVQANEGKAVVFSGRLFSHKISESNKLHGFKRADFVWLTSLSMP